MKTTSNTLKLSIGLIAGTLLTGCNSSEFTAAIEEYNQNANAQNTTTQNSSSANRTSVQSNTQVAMTARFIDSAVSGLSYKANSYSGTTDAKGDFMCKSGEQVAFLVGQLNIGQSACQTIITPQNIASTKTTKMVTETVTNPSGYTSKQVTRQVTVDVPANQNDASVVNRVRFLLTLDTDSNPDNGIQLPSNAEQAKITQTTIDFANTLAFENAVSAIISAMPSVSNRSLVDAATASAHFNTTLAQIQANPSSFAPVNNINPSLRNSTHVEDDNEIENNYEIDDQYEKHNTTSSNLYNVTYKNNDENQNDHDSDRNKENDDDKKRENDHDRD